MMTAACAATIPGAASVRTAGAAGRAGGQLPRRRKTPTVSTTMVIQTKRTTKRNKASGIRFSWAYSCLPFHLWDTRRANRSAGYGVEARGLNGEDYPSRRGEPGAGAVRAVDEPHRVPLPPAEGRAS